MDKDKDGHLLEVALGFLDENADGRVELEGRAVGLVRRFAAAVGGGGGGGGRPAHLDAHVLRFAQFGAQLLDLDEIVAHHVRHVRVGAAVGPGRGGLLRLQVRVAQRQRVDRLLHGLQPRAQRPVLRLQQPVLVEHVVHLFLAVFVHHSFTLKKNKFKN